MSVLGIVLGLLLTISAPTWLFVGLASIAPPVHMFSQLRCTYSLSIFSALWRTVVLLFFASMALTLFVTGVVMLEVTH